MLMSATPFTLFHSRLATLSGELPGVLDGRPESVHDARVATRRIRELLPLLAEHQRAADGMPRRFRRMGRALGSVRNADVNVDMLASLESRVPHAAPALVVLRQEHERVRLQVMRQLIKTFEKLDVERMVRTLARTSTHSGLAGWRLHSRITWQGALRATLDTRGRACVEAVRHATGVYFPNRVHRARIAIKKLRYALEIAEDTGHHRGNDALADLKRTQDVLGELHDRQALLDEFAALDPAQQPPGSADQLRLVAQVVAAEIRALHAAYLTQRGRIVEIAQHELRTNPYFSPRLPQAIALATVAASSSLLWHRRTG
jgi:CHAD domain-containing protein